MDLAYARYFASRDDEFAGAIHYGRGRPGLWTREKLAELARVVDARWRESFGAEDDAVFLRTRGWILGENPARHVPTRAKAGLLPASLPADLAMQKEVWRALFSPGPRPPENAIYLNVAQHALEHAVYFDWLANRPDISAVFFLHDLLPLDFPEFWGKAHEALFKRRMDHMFRHAAALITTSQEVRERALEELRLRGRRNIPILVSPLPSPLESARAEDPRDVDLAARPYFVAVGTIEPRKNHLLLLNAWREMAQGVGPTPRLVIVGERGWENEQVVDMLERCPGIADRVWETHGLSDAGLRRLIANARGLLAPSFAEGFGLPLIEALGLGAPTVASDIPIFHEVAGEAAIFRSPIDGVGWREAILALADADSGLSREARSRAASFRGASADGYFETVREFLAGL